MIKYSIFSEFSNSKNSLKSCGSCRSIGHPAEVFERGQPLQRRLGAPVCPVVVLVRKCAHRESRSVQSEPIRLVVSPALVLLRRHGGFYGRKSSRARSGLHRARHHLVRKEKRVALVRPDRLAGRVAEG